MWILLVNLSVNFLKGGYFTRVFVFFVCFVFLKIVSGTFKRR